MRRWVERGVFLVSLGAIVATSEGRVGSRSRVSSTSEEARLRTSSRMDRVGRGEPMVARIRVRTEGTLWEGEEGDRQAVTALPDAVLTLRFEGTWWSESGDDVGLVAASEEDPCGGVSFIDTPADAPSGDGTVRIQTPWPLDEERLVRVLIDEGGEFAGSVWAQASLEVESAEPLDATELALVVEGRLLDVDCGDDTADTADTAESAAESAAGSG